MRHLRGLSGGNAKASEILRLFDARLNDYDIILSKPRPIRKEWSERDKAAHGGVVHPNPVNIDFSPGHAKILHKGIHDSSSRFFNHESFSECINEFMSEFIRFILDTYQIIFN
jgi:hypothetical protein